MQKNRCGSIRFPVFAYGKCGCADRFLAYAPSPGPKRRLFPGGSSSITPGVPWEKIDMLAEGLRYYRKHGRMG